MNFALRRSLGTFNHRWLVVMLLFTGLLILPVFVIVASVFQPFSGAWEHLYTTVLPDYVLNSLILMFGVAGGTFILGVSTAWLTTMCEFTGRRWLKWALLLPMAMPAYIIAYTYTGMLDFSGPVQSTLRHWFDWRYGDYWFPEIRSIGGAVLMLSLVLYPYVYLIVRAAFIEQSRALLEVSRSLGNGAWKTFFKVALPAARPAIVAGVTLALMETLADYGTVQYFGVSTFTTGIFRTWFGMGELTTAAQLSSVLLFFVFSLMLLERWSRRRMKFHSATLTQRSIARGKLKGAAGFAAFTICLLPVLLGFLLPAAQLIFWAYKTAAQNLNLAFLELMGNSFLLAALASIGCVLLAVLLTFIPRLYPGKAKKLTLRIATLGYAIPGVVIAVGVLIPFAWFDNWLDQWLTESFGWSTGLLLSGTLFALVFAYMVRFLSVSVQTLESGYAKIRTSVDDSARTLGYRPTRVLTGVHLPLLKTSLITAALLVFVDVLKELPTTLILRPFNFNTLAVRAYEMASDERLMDASTAALAIVLIGLVPIFLLMRAMNNHEQ